MTDTRDGGRTLRKVLAYVPSHWQDTLGENPQAIVGVTFQPDGAEVWVPVYIVPAPASDTEDVGEEDVPLWVRRALGLVERALESEDGMRSVMQQTGGNAPELVQGILDGIVRLYSRGYSDASVNLEAEVIQPLKREVARLRASDTEDVGEEDGPTTHEYGTVLECIGLVRGELGDAERAEAAEKQLLSILARR